MPALGITECQMPPQSSLSRREFLYYLWASSMALFMAEAGGTVLWFAYPRFRAGQFGGLFTIDASELPAPGSAPQAYDAGRFWLVQVDEAAVADPRHPEGFATQPGLLALYKICVHLGCLYQWKPTNDRFECPCHGSKYLKDGTRIKRPASRNLDRFVIRALDKDGKVLAETKAGDTDADSTVGQPMPLPPATAALQVDTSKRIEGQRNNGPDRVRD